MATYSEIGSMLSGSDEEILNALCMADDIATEFNLNTSSIDSNSEVLVNEVFDSGNDFPDNSETVSVFGDESEDSGWPKIRVSDNENTASKKYFYTEPEYQDLLQDISQLQVMCDCCIEEHKKLKTESSNLIQKAVLGSKQVLSEAMLNEILLKLQTTDTHVLSIAKQFSQIKQVLRSRPSKSTLKVNPSCQKYVIKFFHLANDLMKNIEKNKLCIENCLENSVDKQKPSNKQLQLQIHERLLQMERRIENLIEFRKNLESPVSDSGSLAEKEACEKTFDTESLHNVPSHSVEINPNDFASSLL